MRQSGILLPITSLPSPYGIGTLGKVSYKWIDFLNLAKQSYWQVLPLGPTSYKDSPYQTFSAFAGNPYLIDLDILKEQGLLNEEDLDIYKNLDLRIDYGFLYHHRFSTLKIAYSNFKKSEGYYSFIEKESYWLDDYALFMAIKNSYNGLSWQQWDSCYKTKEVNALNEFKVKNYEEIEFYKFLQFEFFQQFIALKNYAHSKHVELIGDVPIYVALDSCDVWSNPSIFDLDENLEPNVVAGCPPDDFSKLGQLWGNPVYNWKQIKNENYSWWISRMKKSYEMYDVVRIDHFRGFESFYTINRSSVDATKGKWVKGPGMSFFKKINECIPNARIIAEDLGFLTKAVFRLLKQTKYPGMKVLEFAFSEEDNIYLPHNHIKNCVVYTGTHDNEPLRSWFDKLDLETKHQVREYLALSSDDLACDKMVRVALSSVADLTIIPIQDYLGLGEESRINTPSTEDNNWTFRLAEKYITKELALYIRYLTTLYRRDN